MCTASPAIDEPVPSPLVLQNQNLARFETFSSKKYCQIFPTSSAKVFLTSSIIAWKRNDILGNIINLVLAEQNQLGTRLTNQTNFMTSATNCPYWWLWLLVSWFKVVPSNMQTQKIENLAKSLQSMLLFFHFVRVRPRRLPPPHKGCCLSHIIKYFPFTYFDSLLSSGFKR